MKINEIIVESEEVTEAGFWGAVKAGVKGAVAGIKQSQSDRQYKELSKAADQRNKEIVQNWIYNWNRISAGMPDSRLNSPEKYANELTAFARRALHNNSFTVDTAPTITFNGAPSKATVNPQSVTAFITSAVAQKDVPPDPSTQPAQPTAPGQFTSPNQQAQPAQAVRDSGPVPDPGYWIRIVSPKEKHVYYKTAKGWMTSDYQPIPSETSIKFLNDIADSSGKQIRPNNQFYAKKR